MWSLGHLSLPIIMSSLTHFLGGVQDEFEGYVRDLVVQVAQDYHLDAQELVTRYVTQDAGAPMSPVAIRMVQTLPQLPKAPVAPKVAKVPKVPQGGGSKRGRKPGPGIETLDLTQPLTEALLAPVSIPVLKAVCSKLQLKVGGNRDELVLRIVQAGTGSTPAQVAVVAPQEVSLSPVVLRSPMSPPSAAAAPPSWPQSPILGGPMRGFVAPEEAPEEAPEAPTPPPEMVVLVEALAGRTTDELPVVAPPADEITECVEPETAQDKLRRELQSILNKHQDSDGEEDEGEVRWGDMGDDEGDEVLVQEDYL